ncbi:MAG TPA: hypothetical protein ENK95_03815 [Campylobacterales bacterium]|nr:hypothetical protein [Campylobacterales bacterium]
MHQAYKITINYFLLMLLLIIITGIWIVLLQTSLNLETITNYYVNKSLLGVLEVLTPHLLAMGTVVFILTHFLSFKNKNTSLETKISTLLFLVMLLSNLSLLVITEITPWMIWVKIISLLLFLLFSLFLMWRVFIRKY